MEFRDRELILMDILENEYTSSPINSWSDFIINKDLGINYLFDKSTYMDVYEITDEQKWMLTKLKYGI